MIKKELLIFDLDGTLIDSSSDIAWATNKTLAAMGYKEEGIEHIKENIGWGVKSLLERLMPGENEETIAGARERFLKFYGGHLVVDTYIYEGVADTIRYFREKNKKMAVVTNKPEGLSRRILDELKLSEYFLMVVGGDSLENKKPDPEPVLKVLNTLGASLSASAFIGDSPIDGECGKKAGIYTIGVSYGFRPIEELKSAGFDLIISEFTMLKGIIE